MSSALWLLVGIALIVFGFWLDSTLFLRGIMKAVAIRANQKTTAINAAINQGSDQ